MCRTFQKYDNGGRRENAKQDVESAFCVSTEAVVLHWRERERERKLPGRLEQHIIYAMVLIKLFM